MQPLSEFATGARVIKPDARPFDFAFKRTGTVCREIVDGRPCIGVLWDSGYTWDAGETGIFEYPPDWCSFEPAPRDSVPARA